jgi:hypothetical protein
MTSDNDDIGERARVFGRIAPIILAFARENAGQTFHVEQLRRYVDAHVHEIAPDSPGRILRQLRQLRQLNYVVIDRRNSLYQFRKRVLA